MKTSYLIDMGNTCWKLLSQESDVGGIERYGYGEDPKRGMMDILSKLDLPAAFVIASVRDDSINDALQAQLGSLGCTVRWITWKDCTRINTRYEDPAMLGIDRYLNMVAAMQYYSMPSIIVDAGTTITIDALNASGHHLGGVIFPGRQLLVASLNQKTDKIHVENLAGNDTIFAQNTRAGVTAGIRGGLAAAVSGIIAMMKAELGENARVIFTGGDGGELIQLAGDASAQLDSMLLFSGLRLLGGQ